MEDIMNIINEIIRQQKEYTEKTLAEIITKYDFVVGSKELKNKLMKILPEGANIICSPYVESPTMIYAIKKFDIMDLLFEQRESEEQKNCNTCKHYTLFNPYCECCFDLNKYERRDKQI